MNNKLEIFKNEQFGEVRAVNRGGEPWFVAKDVAEILGYSETSAMTRRLDEEDFISVKMTGMNMKSILLNESGLYSAILGSNLPEAKRFKKWVTSEVLPSIRKNGMFAVDELLDNPDLLIATASKLKEEKQARQLAEAKLLELEPTLEEWKQFIECPNGCVFVDEYSKNLGIGRNKFYEILRELKILQSDIVEVDGAKYKGRRQNIPYQHYMKYFEVKFAVKNDRKFSVTLINNAGQSYIFKRLRKEGVI